MSCFYFFNQLRIISFVLIELSGCLQSSWLSSLPGIDAQKEGQKTCLMGHSPCGCRVTDLVEWKCMSESVTGAWEHTVIGPQTLTDVGVKGHVHIYSDLFLRYSSSRRASDLRCCVFHTLSWNSLKELTSHFVFIHNEVSSSCCLVPWECAACWAFLGVPSVLCSSDSLSLWEAWVTA